MGHLTRIANAIIESADKGSNVDRIKDLLGELPSETSELWAKFTGGTLAEVNKQNAVELVSSFVEIYVHASYFFSLFTLRWAVML
jgi:hypothetical protein